MINPRTHSRGYIAVVTAIILSSTLMALVFTSSTNIFWERLNQLSKENRETNEALAGSCAYEALMQYAEDSNSITGNEPIEIQPGVDCVIDSVSTSFSSQTFKVHANVHSSYVGLNITSTQSTSTGIMSMTTWRDITSIPP